MRNNGVPLIEQAPRAPITQSIISMAEDLVGNDKSATDERGEGRGRWLSFWGKTKARS
jgi:pilus assembly protein CpaE